MVGLKMANSWTDPTCVIMVTLIPGFLIAYPVANFMIAKYFGIIYMPLLTLAIYLWYQFIHLNTPPAETTKYIEFKVRTRIGRGPPRAPARPAAPPAHPAATPRVAAQNQALQKRWGTRKVPMHMLVSWFLADEIAFKGDCLEVLEKHREEFVDWRCAHTAAPHLSRPPSPRCADAGTGRAHALTDRRDCV